MELEWALFMVLGLVFGFLMGRDSGATIVKENIIVNDYKSRCSHGGLSYIANPDERYSVIIIKDGEPTGGSFYVGSQLRGDIAGMEILEDHIWVLCGDEKTWYQYTIPEYELRGSFGIYTGKCCHEKYFLGKYRSNKSIGELNFNEEE